MRQFGASALKSRWRWAGMTVLMVAATALLMREVYLRAGEPAAPPPPDAQSDQAFAMADNPDGEGDRPDGPRTFGRRRPMDRDADGPRQPRRPGGAFNDNGPPPPRDGDRGQMRDGNGPPPPRDGDRGQGPPPRDGDRGRMWAGNGPPPRGGDRDGMRGERGGPPGPPQQCDGPPRGPEGFGQRQRGGPEDRSMPPGPPRLRGEMHADFGPPPARMPGHFAGPSLFGMRPERGFEAKNPELIKLMKEGGELEQQSRELGQQYRQASPEKREEIKKQLQDVVNKHFELRQKCREQMLKQVENQIEKMRAGIQRRNKARDQIIERRMAEVLGEDDLSF